MLPSYFMLPSYIDMPMTQFIDQTKQAPLEGSIVGCYWNILFPLDVEREWRPKFDEWIYRQLHGSLDDFPLNDQIMAELGRNVFEYGPSRQVEIIWAEELRKF